jgi:alkyl hydroperoxide reductase subunit AhpF
MTPHDEKMILDWMARQTAPVKLALAGDAGAAGQRLAQFCDRLKTLAPIVQTRPAPEEPFRKPAMIVGRHGNIAFQAVPEEKELPPFLHALGSHAENEARVASDLIKQSARIELPADLTLFITMQCPHCPTTATELISIANTTPHLRIAIVDGMLFTDQAQNHDIRSVPTLILDDRIRWTGRIKLAEVIQQCIQRDPTQLSAASLRQIIESGEAARAAAMMAAHGQLFPALIELLTSERWSVRLGAMVTVEYLADEAPDLSARLVEPLWNQFETLSEAIQGDVVQILGQIRSDAAKGCLQSILSGDYPESVKEAAEEELGG